jgi:predicted phosphodiesterase
MKRIVLGDIHGHLDIFEEIYNKENPDEVIVLGDYFDSRTVKPEDQYSCFEKLLEIRKEHKENKVGKFILLIGNHDFQYMYGERYSGYNVGTYLQWHDKLNELLKKGVLSFAFVDGVNKTVYSHAGITNTWLNKRADQNTHLSYLDKLNFDKYEFTYGTHFNSYGDDPWNSCIWVRPASLSKDMYVDNNGDLWTQIVGHTQTKDQTPIVLHKDGSLKHNSEPWWMGKLWIIDTLPSYYIIEDIDDETFEVLDRKLVFGKDHEDGYQQ